MTFFFSVLIIDHSLPLIEMTSIFHFFALVGFAFGYNKLACNIVNKLLQENESYYEFRIRRIRQEFMDKHSTGRQVVSYKTEKHVGDSCECPLCSGKIEDGEELYHLPCEHKFHVNNCLGNKTIVDWVNEHATCPACSHFQ